MSISGHFIYNNLAISQNPQIFNPLNELIVKVKPSRILEIGTSQGGLTSMIRDILDNNNLTFSNLTTYDIYEPVFLQNHINSTNQEITIKVETLFCSQYKLFKNEDVKKEIKSYIQKDGVTIVMCDGGNKSSEFNLFSDLLKTQDIIMAHDYAPSKEYFEEYMTDKIWNWHEIQDSDIRDSIMNNNLQPYMREEFLNVAWACFQKL
jgi:hypothetical protein